MHNILWFIAGMVAQAMLHRIEMNMFLNDHPELFGDDRDDED